MTAPSFKSLLCFFAGIVVGIVFIMLIATGYQYFSNDVEIELREATMAAFNAPMVWEFAVMIGVATGIIAARDYEESKYR